MENELMKDNELTNAIQQIHVVQGSVQFGAFEDLKQQATKLADQIQMVEVTEDNVKVSKQLLATVNKRLKTLEDKRISIKKMMLEPYQEFEDQVKEIVGIVKEADLTVREQVKGLEEDARIDKELEIASLFQKRIQQYTFKDFVPFMDFIKPKHLTKTMTIQAVEKEMVQFFEQVERDMSVIYQMDEVDNHINAYLNTYDLGQAITIVKRENERKAQIEEARKKTTKKEEIQGVYHISIFNQKDAKMVEMFMQQNNIKFEMKKG